MQSFTPRFARAFSCLIGNEGGFVNDPKDRGGATKYGVSLRYALLETKADRSKLAHFDVDMDGDVDVDDIRALTLDQAEQIYFDGFWLPNACAALPLPIGEMVFDQAVNGGSLAARKLLQRALRRFNAAIKDDGVIGIATMTALDTAMKTRGGLTVLAQAYRDEAKARYRKIVTTDPTQARFLKGWLARADRLGAA
jgi:lysozyme family protein